MNEDDEKFDNPVVEELIGFVFEYEVLGDAFLHELQEVRKQLEVQVPVFVLFEYGGEEVLVADEFDPGEGEVGVEERVDFVEFLGQDVVEGSDLLLGEVVLLPGCVAYKV